MAEPRLLAWLATIVEALESSAVRYGLAGGIAQAVWATPRATADIDLVIASDPDSIEKVRRACADAGVLQTRRNLTRFKRISLLRMIAAPPDAEPIAIDFLVLPAAFERDVLGRTNKVSLQELTLAVVSPEDLVLMKLFRFSEQDRVDIRAVARDRALDRRYLERQARALKLLVRLRRALPR